MRSTRTMVYGWGIPKIKVHDASMSYGVAKGLFAGVTLVAIGLLFSHWYDDVLGWAGLAMAMWGLYKVVVAFAARRPFKISAEAIHTVRGAELARAALKHAESVAERVPIGGSASARPTDGYLVAHLGVWLVAANRAVPPCREKELLIQGFWGEVEGTLSSSHERWADLREDVFSFGSALTDMFAAAPRELFPPQFDTLVAETVGVSPGQASTIDSLAIEYGAYYWTTEKLVRGHCGASSA